MSAGQIDKVKLGRTGLAVTKLGLHLRAWRHAGDLGYAVDADWARATLKAIFRPGEFLDTARIYGYGRSEERIGAALADIGGLPMGFVIASKVDRDFATNAFDGSRVRRSLEESLAALGLDRIHLMNLHDPEYASDVADIAKPGGALSELFKLKQEGLVTGVGLAAGRVDLMMPLVRDWDFDAIMTHNRFTLPNRNAEAMIDFCVGKGIAVLNAAPYASGVLAKGADQYKKYAYQDASEETLSPIRRIEEICNRYEVPTGAAALQFSMRDERVTSTVVGVSKPERIAQTLEWADWPIPDAMWDELLALPFATDDPEAERELATH
jgi:D-threo-aldose 1-dehydrogenase